MISSRPEDFVFVLDSVAENWHQRDAGGSGGSESGFVVARTRHLLDELARAAGDVEAAVGIEHEDRVGDVEINLPRPPMTMIVDTPDGERPDPVDEQGDRLLLATTRALMRSSRIRRFVECPRR